VLIDMAYLVVSIGIRHIGQRTTDIEVLTKRQAREANALDFEKGEVVSLFEPRNCQSSCFR